MTVRPNLTAELRGRVLRLEDDLRTRLAADSERDAEWRAEHRRALDKRRTAASWTEWRDERITLAAVAWVLTTVFLRFCEDNALISQVWITAPGRRQEALDAEREFLRETARTNPDVTHREWLLDAIDYLAGRRATANLVDGSSPLWLISPSGDAAESLLAFWRERDDDDALLRDFADPTLDTRFLGDLYQDLSEAAKKRYALLQTPEFVEEFILDRTLEPALAERPLEGFKLIDPTCGSGHFLLSAFDRFLDRWHRQAPGMNERERVQKALDSVYGVDINPYAIAIAKFRLTVAAMRASSLASLEGAPAFDYHLATGDSLLFGDTQTLQGDADVHDFVYETEDLTLLDRMLTNGQYDAVVGNPPYITVKDKALNADYRQRYDACKGVYAMTVPFMQRFFALAKSGTLAGWVGQITSNSFMKREFGAPLIERVLARLDLRLVADTSGAYIPGHGTPTVIIAGRNTRPAASTVRAVLGVRGEPGQPAEAAKGLVWTSIVEHVDEPGWSDEWVSVVDLDRNQLQKHPWSLSGGGANDLTAAIDSQSRVTLGDRVAGRIGFASFPGADDVFFAPRESLLRDRVPVTLVKSVVTGDVVRDWEEQEGDWALAPYDSNADLVPLDEQTWGRRLWPQRTTVGSTTGFGGERRQDTGKPWWGWYRWVASRYRTPLTITFAFVATHNHFVLDRGGKVFKQSAPVIKLPAGATEEDHFGLLGILNSSTACFWLKQNSHAKGLGGVNQESRSETWEGFYEFTGTTLQDLPLPSELPTEYGSRIDDLARRAELSAPDSPWVEPPDGETIEQRRWVYPERRALMIFEQEELDWHTYGLYGLIDEDLTDQGSSDTRMLRLGQRAFEIVLARRIAAGEEESSWFTRHGSTPITELPSEWPDDYRELVERRIRLIESHSFIRLLERPEYKRRWAAEPFDKQLERSLRNWLLDRLEDRSYWFDKQGRPTPRSVLQLADLVGRDSELVSVLELWEGRPGTSVADSLQRVLADQAVPYLAAFRYKEPGLRKRAAWEETWALQRREDAGERLAEPIPVPPKYTTADFTRTEYWSHRGKLDVPKERFVLYPQAGRDTDPTPLLGWAGWDHAQQSLALAVLIQERTGEGWSDQRLVPLVAGLAELLPWVQQWHEQPEALYGGTSPADFFAEQLRAHATQVNHTTEQLAAWRPEPARRGRRKSTA